VLPGVYLLFDAELTKAIGGRRSEEQFKSA
jgi:hypothetical protein